MIDPKIKELWRSGEEDLALELQKGTKGTVIFGTIEYEHDYGSLKLKPYINTFKLMKNVEDYSSLGNLWLYLKYQSYRVKCFSLVIPNENCEDIYNSLLEIKENFPENFVNWVITLTNIKLYNL